MYATYSEWTHPRFLYEDDQVCMYHSNYYRYAIITHSMTQTSIL